MTFPQAILETVQDAQRRGRLMYLYCGDGRCDYRLSAQYWPDWLFRAYPGGRKELSSRGVALLTAMETPPTAP